MRKTITIQSVSVYKQGENASGPWQLLNVIDTDGKKYSSFLNLYEGKTYDCEVVSDPSTKINPKTGKPYQNYKITNIYPTGETAVPKKDSEALILIREIHQMLVDLTTNLAEKAAPTDKTPF